MIRNVSKVFVIVFCASLSGLIIAADDAEKAALVERILASQRQAQDAERARKEREIILREQAEKRAVELQHVEAQQIADHRKRLEQSRVYVGQVLALNELVNQAIGKEAVRRFAGAEGRG